MPHCFHCQLECDQSIASEFNGCNHYFCCHGCQAVTHAIFDGGLGDFYRHRDQHNQKADAVAADFTCYDLEEIQADFVITTEQGLKQAYLSVGGITCAACVWLMEKHLEKIEGIEDVNINAASHRAVITFDSQRVRLSRVLEALNDIGYPCQPLLEHEQEGRWRADQRTQLLRLGVAGIGMMQSGMVAVALHAGSIQGMETQWVGILRWVNLLFTLPILLYSAQPFFVAAWRSLKVRHLVMDVSVSAALLLAFLASFYATVTVTGEVYYDSVAMFTFFLLLARYLENRARWQNRQASVLLRRFMPTTVVLMDGRQKRFIPLKQLRVGDRVWVAAGQVFPCDGVVSAGTSEADESLLTGEPLPLPKTCGDRVLAGSHNGNAGLEIVADAVAGQTELAAIERLMTQAEQQRPRQVILADRFAGRFVAAVLVTAAVAGVAWCFIQPDRALWVALSVLVVTCPCALSLATPAVLTAAVNRLRQNGVLVTSAFGIEELQSVNTVVFDKTGTLTTGDMKVAKIMPLAQQNQEQILAIVSALEAGSSHPIARAFVDLTSTVKVEQRQEMLGFGVSGEVDANCYRFGQPEFAWPNGKLENPGEGLWLLLADLQRPIAWIELDDKLRDSAEPCVAQLKALAMHLVLLSGDRKSNVARVAELLGFQTWAGQMLPADKLDYLKQLQTQNAHILMLGDGLNDLPILSGANVSCAMGSATDLARTKADCILLQDDLTQIPRALRVAHHARSIIRQNVIWAILYNLVALPLAVCGLVPPWLAALGMSSSSLVVVINALRVGR